MMAIGKRRGTDRLLRIALLSAAAAVVVYVAMLVGYRQGWGWLSAADHAGLQADYRIGSQHPDWVRFWYAITTIFKPQVFRLLAVIAAGAEIVRRRPRSALFLLVAVEMTEPITRLAKHSVCRPRPVDALVKVSSYSFPSGHALGVVVGVGALLAVIVPLLRPRAQAVAIAAGVLVVVAVGVSRVALVVHHISDVVAGWALGWVWLVVVAAVFRPWRSERGEPLHD